MAHVVVASTQNLQQQIQVGRHRFFSDEPIEAGGNDTGPDPYGLLLSALGA
jgi:putative redox protein